MTPVALVTCPLSVWHLHGVLLSTCLHDLEPSRQLADDLESQGQVSTFEEINHLMLQNLYNVGFTFLCVLKHRNF